MEETFLLELSRIILFRKKELMVLVPVYCCIMVDLLAIHLEVLLLDAAAHTGKDSQAGKGNGNGHFFVAGNSGSHDGAAD